MNMKLLSTEISPLAPEEDGHLFEQIAERLREQILTGEYRPGDRISEKQVAESFSISRTPAREALRILHREGAVRLYPNRGAYVPEYDRRMILDAIEMVEYLESAAGELSCRRITEEEVQWIEFLTQKMAIAHREGDRIEYYKLNRRIHESIVAATRNQALISEYKKYNARLYRVRFAPNQNTEGWRDAMHEHDEMTKLLALRDGEKLSTLLRKHLSHAWRRFGFDPATAAQD